MDAKLIRLFLVDGKPNGLRTVEISNMTIHGTFFPRTQLELFSQRDAATKPGVYILIGSSVTNPEETVVYIGEGDPVLPRLKSHSKNKDFWTEAIVFSSKDDYLTKTQIKYLETELYVLAKDAFRAKLDNSQAPTRPNISEVDRAEVNQFFGAIKVIISSLGISIFEPRIVDDSSTTSLSKVYELKNKKTLAKMAVIDNKYVVLKGSTAVLKDRPSSAPFIIKLRTDLVDAGIMEDKGDGLYTFVQDASFNSPSYAASAIVGGSENGRAMWKIEDKSLKDIENEVLDDVQD